MTNELAIRTGLDALPANADKSSWTPEQAALMTSLGLKGVKNRKVNGQWVEQPFEAPPSIVQAFLHQARTRRLDPLARQIYCIERGGKWGIEASIDGFRLQAERSGQYRGQTDPQWTDGTLVQVPLREDGTIVRDGAGNPIMVEDYRWVNVWVDEERPPIAARIGIKREGFPEPIWGVATYAGYCPRDRDGELRPTGQWGVNPSNQLLKCAEMLGLRKTFPAELSGIYGAEEMDQAGVPRDAVKAAETPAKPVGEPVAQAPITAPTITRDWAAEAETKTTVEELTALANEADALGEIGLRIGLAGDNDDGSAHTVIDVLKARRREIEEASQPEPLVTAGTAAPNRKWAAEASKLTTRADVGRLRMEAIANNAPEHVLTELESMERKLPDPGVDAEDGAWAKPEGESGGWVQNEAGEFVEADVPAVLDESVEASK